MTDNPAWQLVMASTMAVPAMMLAGLMAATSSNPRRRGLAHHFAFTVWAVAIVLAYALLEAVEL